MLHQGKPGGKRYFWLQILNLDNYGWIDFAKSALAETVNIGSELDLKQMIEARKADFFIHFTRITLNSLYARCPFDLFYLEWLGGLSSSAPLISGRLKSALEREKVTGYRLVERPHLVLEGC